MRILITGINGFIGKNLAEKLLKKGHLVKGLGQDKKCKVTNIKTYYSGSVLDKKLVEKAIKDVEIVIHLAALTSHKEIVDNRSEVLKTTLLGTKNVLEAFSESKKTRKFLYASSGKVYGKIIHLPITENHPTNPQNLLGKSKLEAEKLIKSRSDNKKEFIIFRIFNVYGPGQGESFLAPTILSQLNQEKKEVILGDIEVKRDWVYIDDVVWAFILAIEKKGPAGVSVYNICTGKASSASQIVKTIGKIKGIDIKVKSNPKLLRPDEAKDEYGSFELAKRTLGWKPKVSLRDGLWRLLN